MILFLDAVIRLMFLLTTALNWLLHKFLLLAEIFAFLFKTRIVVFTLFFDRLHLGDQRFGISWLQNSSTSVWYLIFWIIESQLIYYLFMPDMFWHLVGVVFRILFFWPLSSTALVFSAVEGAYSNFLLLLIIISLKLLLIQTTYALLEWAVLFHSLRYWLEVESQISCLIKGCVEPRAMLTVWVCWLIKEPAFFLSIRLRLFWFFYLWRGKFQVVDELFIAVRRARFYLHKSWFAMSISFWGLYQTMTPDSRLRGQAEHLLRKLVTTCLLWLFYRISGGALVEKWIVGHRY